MSFLGTDTAPTAADEVSLTNDGWFPAIALAELRAAVRLDGTVTPARLRHAAVNAMASVNGELASYKEAQLQAGHAGLADVPAPQVAGESVQLQRYRRAVYACVQADLIEHYRDFDTTGAGDKAADKLELRVHDLRRDVRWAISDLVGRRRTTVELI
ncbi:head completion/stabilization protein [Pelomonas sp. BJYL3]|uniref:head completion/stabilization protein n=1 Tax=Pelomonas sp. BJYL3 TaxID=2976697 RepID=UPI0022B37EFC|nr:head completion/stabilization protein [Pelomonas sp. BJYL3]